MARDGGKRLFDWLKDKQIGQVVGADEICSVAGWKRSTLSTYRGKNMFAGALEKLGPNEYCIARVPPKLTWGEFNHWFSQVKVNRQ